MKRFYQRGLLIVLFLITATTSSFAKNGEDVILEISDKYEKIRLGITDSNVYMVLDESLMPSVNALITSQNTAQKNSYLDSRGIFIPGYTPILTSNVIRIPISEIACITFDKGKLDFHYNTTPTFDLESILVSGGQPALDNFFIEDLEKFYVTLSKIS